MRVSLGGRLTNPAAELAKYENEHPSVDLIEDFKNVIEDHGLKYEEIRATAEAYDYLRIARCRSAAISERDGIREEAKNLVRKEIQKYAPTDQRPEIPASSTCTKHKCWKIPHRWCLCQTPRIFEYLEP